MEPKETKKTEKLVTAIYMITSFFDDKEPMKWRLRELGNGLISHKDVPSTVTHILTLLTVAKNTGLVSDMNYEIIHREFSRLLPESTNLQGFFGQPEEALPAPTSKVERSIYISSSIASTPAPIVETAKDKAPLVKEFGVVAVKKNSRQSVIINLLKRKKEIMIKDVSPLIDGVSEKTIQRELLAMVKAGILNKIGEKRWSRYTLA